MAIRLTDHVRRRIAERSITVAWIERVLAAPDWAAPDRDPLLTNAFKAIPEFGGRILKVVHRPEGADILVVTAFFDRSARR